MTMLKKLMDLVVLLALWLLGTGIVFAQANSIEAFDVVQQGGNVVIRMLENVKQKTIGPLITSTIAAGTLVNTDEYDIYARLEQWGYRHQAVCHGRGEYARDDDGDGFHEVHVNTMEGFWSLLRSWLRPHRGIS